MTFKKHMAVLVLSIASTSLVFADDNAPSADAVTGTSGSSAMSDDWTSSGENQESSQNSGIVPPNTSSPSNSPMSRDGETMGDEDY